MLVINYFLDMDTNKCNMCNISIHPAFIGYHKCGYSNCPICKEPVTPSKYWFHLRSHPGHENDSPQSKKPFEVKKY
jgi:hypothetical protein